MGQIFVIAGIAMSIIFTLVGMIINLASSANRRAVGLGGDVLAQVLYIIGSVFLVGLAGAAMLVAIIGAGKLSCTKTVKGLGLILAALPYFSGYSNYYQPWWFFMLVGSLLIVLGGMAMEGRLMEEAPTAASPE